jgi:hypothetical protein
MNTRRIVGCLLLVACVAAVSLGAANSPSALVTGNLDAVASGLGVGQEGGYYSLAELLEAVVERLPTEEASTAGMLDLLPGEPIRAGQTARLTFHTLLGDFAQYRLVVVYLTTSAPATADTLEGPPERGGENEIWWEWTCGTSVSGQSAVGIVTASWPNGVHLTRYFEFRVE